MMEDRKDELSKEERKAFRAFKETQSLSPGNEERVVTALKERGLIRSSSHKGRRLFVRAAAVAAVLGGTFFLGMEYGRQSNIPVEPLMTPTAGEQPESTWRESERNTVEDPSILDEYRDEPDRPGNGKILLVRYSNP